MLDKKEVIIKSEYYYARRFAMAWLTLNKVFVKTHVAPIRLARTLGVYNGDGVKKARKAVIEWYGKAIISSKKETTKIDQKYFYSSSAWRTIRYKAFEKYGARCKICGVNSTSATLHVDHIKPRSKFPELALELTNLQILCFDCNLGKSDLVRT